MNTLDAMNSCTAMRYFKDDPVPREVLKQLLYAATRASNPGNSQGWEFLVLEDREIKERLGAKVLEGMEPFFAGREVSADAVEERMLKGAEHLAKNFARVPVWIVGMARKVYPPHAPQDSFMASTVYPAAQNLIVAARSLGIGTCFTTFPGHAESEIRNLCQVPDDLYMLVYIAVGYPARSFQAVKRKPLEDVVVWNRYP